jgi:hypothetical protein
MYSALDIVTKARLEDNPHIRVRHASVVGVFDHKTPTTETQHKSDISNEIQDHNISMNHIMALLKHVYET